MPYRSLPGTILLVESGSPASDGVPVVADIVYRLLPSRYNYQVVKDQESVSALLERDQVDVAIIPAGIDGRSGLLERLVAHKIPTLVLSNSSDQHTAVLMLKGGAKDYLTVSELSAETLNRAIVTAFQKSRMEHELVERQQELEHFAYVASHDLNAPLAKIQASATLLSDEYGASFDKGAKDLLAIINRSCGQMQRLISDLLSYSRVGRTAQEKQNVSLDMVLKSVELNLEPLIKGTGGAVEVESLPTVLGIESSLLQLFQNLIENALKYRGKAPLVVKVKLEQSDDPAYYMISVSDNGVGVPKELHKKIFLPFERGVMSGKIPGSGIGLAICAKVVKQHGGKIWIESHEGEGTKVLFTIARSL